MARSLLCVDIGGTFIALFHLSIPRVHPRAGGSPAIANKDLPCVNTRILSKRTALLCIQERTDFLCFDVMPCRSPCPVVSAELPAFVRVESAFEQRADSRRIDLRPVERGCL